jgi:hypothetical protein
LNRRKFNRKKANNERLLVNIAGTKNAMKLRRRDRFADVNSAAKWMDEQNQKAYIRYMIKEKKHKSGKRFKAPYADWSAMREDVDGDGIPEDVVRRKNRIRYVQGFKLA